MPQTTNPGARWITRRLGAKPAFVDENVASALGGTTNYVSTEMLGSIATSVAVLAVAAMGVAMLAGRLNSRRALLAVVGCFVVFSAQSIADGLLGLTTAGMSRTAGAADMPDGPATHAPPAQYDPYAGAAVPIAGEDVLGSTAIR